MPPRNQVPAKMSARSVYSRQPAPAVTVQRGRGRPRKDSATEKNAKSKILKKKAIPKAKKRKSSVRFKHTAEYIEIDSPDNEFSSEEENTQSIDEDASKKAVKKNRIKAKKPEKEQESEEEELEDSASEEDRLEIKGSGSKVTQKKFVTSKKKQSKVTTKFNKKAEDNELEEELDYDFDEELDGEEDDEELDGEEDDEELDGEEDDEELDGEEDDEELDVENGEELVEESDEELNVEDMNEGEFDLGGDEDLEEMSDGDLNGEFDEKLEEEYDTEPKEKYDELQEDNYEEEIDNIVVEESDDDSDIRYSFPEPNASSTSKTEEKTSNEKPIPKKKQALSKKKARKDKIAKKLSRSDKRKVMPENEVVEKRQQSFNEGKTPTPQKKIKLENEGSSQNRLNSFVTSETPSNSSNHFISSHISSPHQQSSFHIPHLSEDFSNSQISNRFIPCGNIAADEAFRWLIGPTLPEDFYCNIFEKMPYLVKRGNHSYYKDLFNGNDINTMLKENNLEYGVHIDVVKYVRQSRVPIEADGRAYSSNVWEDYKQGYSLRLRNPQSYNKNLWNLCSLLQEYFSSTVGVNVYLTPPRAQGFPPHYDDIDAFIVQVEGRKYWKVYPPRFEEEELARYSSKDFSENSIGSPILEICLHAGDMLYIPRGYIHQAATDGNAHSLHLTFSTNQLNTWGDLLLEATGKAVEKAILKDVEFRESIPKDYMDHIGSSVSDSKSFKRYEIINKVRDLAQKAMSYIDVDEAADVHSVKFLQASLPPVFNKVEKEHSLHGNGNFWKNGIIKMKAQITQDTKIKLIKKRSLRLVIEDDTPRLYHNLENSRDPRPPTDSESYATFVDLDMDAVPSYLFLLKKFPSFVQVKDIPINDPEGRLSFATSLYDNGLLMTKDPLPPLENEEIRSPVTIISFKREKD